MAVEEVLVSTRELVAHFRLPVPVAGLPSASVVRVSLDASLINCVRERQEHCWLLTAGSLCFTRCLKSKDYILKSPCYWSLLESIHDAMSVA